MYDTTSDSEFCVQVRSTSPLPPPVWAASPTTCRGAGFDGEVGVLVGAGDVEDGEGAGVELVGVGVVVAALELGWPCGFEWPVHAVSARPIRTSDPRREPCRIFIGSP